MEQDRTPSVLPPHAELAGQGATDFETIVDLIGHTRTAAGLRVQARLDAGTYPTGVVPTQAEMEALSLGACDERTEPAASGSCPRSSTAPRGDPNLVLDLGVNPKEAQQLARHSTVNLTMNVYGRTKSEYLSGVVERLYTSRCVQLLCNRRRQKSRLPLRLLAMRGMPKGGFEPPRPVRHHPLKMACLPFPPLRHFTPGKTGFRGAKEAQHSACARPLSTAFSGRLAWLLCRPFRRLGRGCVLYRRGFCGSNRRHRGLAGGGRGLIDNH